MDARALRRMATEVDEQHRESMRTVTEDLFERHFDTADPARVASRRSFLGRVGLGGAAIAVGGLAIPVFSGVASAAEDYTPADPDVELAVFAWSLELTAVAAYRLAETSKLADTQLVEVFGMFGRHHADHADAFKELLKTVKPAKVGGTTSTTTEAVAIQQLVDTLGPQIQDAATIDDLLTTLQSVEEGAAATYLLALENLQDVVMAEAAAKILPVESQHAVVLSQALGQPIADYVPSFQSTAAAFDPTAYTG